ncbi:MAG: energy-coupling factor ABC transporter permease [Anaerolineaceae bacterium]
MLAAPVLMHIPDGFLSLAVALVFWAISIPVILVSLRQVNRQMDERQAPLMGVLAAAIFAAQMLNFSVTGGTSGHLIGAALAAILLGPWQAVLVMTAVVSVQALIFQDGGLLTMGANLFNMAILAPAVAYAVYLLVQKIANGRRGGILGGGFAAAWSSVFIASLCAALQLALSGTSPANIAIPAMAGIHTLIGLGEGLITVGALALIYTARRDLITHPQENIAHGNAVWVGGSLAAIALAVISPLASSSPDGLEWVAERYGFIETAKAAPYTLIPDYTLPGIANSQLATILAGIVGVIIVFGVVMLTAVNKHHRKNKAL